MGAVANCEKCSFTFGFGNVVAGVYDLNEISSVLHCLRSWFSPEGRSLCAEMTAAVVRTSQEAISQRECLLAPSRLTPCLEVFVGNSGALEEGT